MVIDFIDSFRLRKGRGHSSRSQTARCSRITGTASWLAIAFGLSAAPQAALKPLDSELIPLFQKYRPELNHFAILLRHPVDEQRDLVAVLASPQYAGEDPYKGDHWWTKNDVVGLFIQKRRHPASVRSVAFMPAKSEEDGAIRILRATRDELVIARLAEKSAPLENVELLFDLDRPKLRGDIRYLPFRVSRTVTMSGVPRFVASNGKYFVSIRPATVERFEIVNDSAPPTDVEEFQPVRFGPGGRFSLVQENGGFYGKFLVIRERAGSGDIRFPLPQTEVEEFGKLRPQMIRDGWRPGAANIEEEIGPYQVSAGLLWFGKTFYDAEGMTGVGGFGYLDTPAGKYRLYSPPAMRDWSVSAMLVEPDAVWVALFHRGEYGDTPGGLIRFDRSSQQVRKYRLRSIAQHIARYQGRLYLGTSDGVAVLDSEGVHEFFVEYTPAGGPALAERNQ